MPFPLLLAGLAFGAKFGVDILGAEQQEAMLDKLKLESEILADEQSLKRTNQISNVIAAQNAEGAARGIAPGSASLSAITINSLNKYSEDEHAAALNLSIEKEAIEAKKKAAAWSPFTSAVSNLFDFAKIYGYYDLYDQENRYLSKPILEKK